MLFSWTHSPGGVWAAKASRLRRDVRVTVHETVAVVAEPDEAAARKVDVGSRYLPIPNRGNLPQIDRHDLTGDPVA